jgi:prefoldin subunit 5
LEKRVVLQRLQKSFTPLSKGVVYYTIISAFNSLRLTDREIQLLAYTNFRGTISSITAKNQFCNIYDTSLATVNNLISKLKKKKLLVKTGGKICVNHVLNINLKDKAILHIKLNNATEEVT